LPICGKSKVHILSRSSWNERSGWNGPYGYSAIVPLLVGAELVARGPAYAGEIGAGATAFAPHTAKLTTRYLLGQSLAVERVSLKPGTHDGVGVSRGDGDLQAMIVFGA
jgi:hypothetical protein